MALKLAQDELHDNTGLGIFCMPQQSK